ncbi:hypothetical protein DMENIID0001_011050 [Sergentomyia squamirostris]
MEKNPLDLNEDDDIIFIHSTVPTRYQNKLNLNLVSSDSSSASSSSSDDEFPAFRESRSSPVDVDDDDEEFDNDPSMERVVVIEPKLENIPKAENDDDVSVADSAEGPDRDDMAAEEFEEKPILEDVKPNIDQEMEDLPEEKPSMDEDDEKENEDDADPIALPKRSSNLSVKFRTYNSAHKRQKNNVMRRPGPNKYTCQYCAKGCMHLETLERHMMKKHQDMLAEKGNTCKLCKSKFSNFNLLICHIKTHNQKFPCAICGRRFSSQKFLDFHVNVHYHEKEFPCELCDMDFCSAPDLKNHYLWHEEDVKNI